MHIASSSYYEPIGAVVALRWSLKMLKEGFHVRILGSGRELKLEDFDRQTGEAVYRAPGELLKSFCFLRLTSESLRNRGEMLKNNARFCPTEASKILKACLESAKADPCAEAISYGGGRKATAAPKPKVGGVFRAMCFKSLLEGR